MKKYLALFLALVLALGCFAGCTETENNPDASEPSSSTPSTPSTPGTPEYEVISITRALELCGEPGTITTEKYYVRGTVETVKNPAYGNMVLTDGTYTIEVYGITGYASMADKPYKGDEVLLCGYLQNFNGTKEIKDAELIEFKHNTPEVDEADYTAMTIAEAREAAEGTKIKVTGTVMQVTYANGMIPSGVIIADDTSSIYVYSGDIAGRAALGNQVTVLASKTWWILPDEANNAAKFGYKGCCQLENAVLLNVEDGTHEFDESWIQETTVKEIMDNPMSNDITAKIFKVNAMVRKVPGSGFVNYYFNDLDDTTGSYTYTQCNGSDFAWLDAFDGKICTVWLVALNAKSSQAGCVYRFLPIKVSDDGFQFNKNDTAEFAVKYYGVDQFMDKYTGNPKLEVVTSVSSELLGFENATLSYSSSNTAVLDFKIENGKTVMHCLKSGKVTVTVTGSYGGKTHSQTVEITVQMGSVQGSSVSWAIGQAEGKDVLVKGIVGPSLVNKVGFYLIDNTGIIAVETDAETMASLHIGDQVAIQGVRAKNTKSGGSMLGQTCIKEAKVVGNAYGDHAYATNNFVTDKTLADFAALDVNTDYTTTVFVLKATVVVNETPFYTNMYLTDGNVQVNLYCANANQYGWLKTYAGQEVTLEMAACNWNSKTSYAGCVLAVRHKDGTKTLNTLNFTTK